MKMRMKWKKSLAFVMMTAMLFGDVVPAFAAEVSNTNSLSEGVYTLDKSGNFVMAEEVNTEAVTKIIGCEETAWSAEESDMEAVANTESSEENEITTEAVTAEEKATAELNVVSEEITYEERLEIESQNDENAVFAVFVENQEPQYFYSLDTLKDYINTDENRAETVYNIEIRQSLTLSQYIDFSDVTAAEIRLNLCHNTITIGADVTIAVNSIYEGNVIVSEGKTLTLLPLYSQTQKQNFLNCGNLNFDFGGYASKLVLSDNSQTEEVYTQINFNNNKFTGTSNAALELNGSVYWDGHKANEMLLEDGSVSFEETEKIIFNEITINNDISKAFVQENGEEWYENVFIGVPVLANRLNLNADVRAFSVNVKENVNVNSFSRLNYTAPSVLSNITVNTQNLEENQTFELGCERVFNTEGNLLSEGSLTLKGTLNDGDGRRLIFLTKYSNTISKHVEDENNWWIEENPDWKNAGYEKDDIIAKIIVPEGAADNAAILKDSNYDMHSQKNGLGLDISKSDENENTYIMKVCQYEVLLNVFERVFEENGNGNWRPQFLYQKGFASFEAANEYIKKNADEQKQFNVILTKDTVIEEADKNIFNYSDYKTYVEIILDGYHLTVNTDMTICAKYIDGSRCRENGEITGISKITVANGKTLTILPQDKEEEQDFINVNYLKFDFDNSNLVFGGKEYRTHVNLYEVDFENPVKNLVINGSFYFDQPLTEGNDIEVTETLTVSNQDAEAAIYVPVTVKNLELDGNLSVSDFQSTGILTTDNNNRFNVAADGKAVLNDIKVTVNPEEIYSRFVISMDQKVALGKYSEYTAEQWENIFRDWEDELEIPEDIFEEVNVISERGALSINGVVTSEENHISPIQLEKSFCWEVARSENAEDIARFSYGIEFGKKTESEAGETVAIVSKAPVETFTLSYPDSCLVKVGNELKTMDSQVGLLREGTNWVTEYESFDSAVAAIDKRKDTEARYVIILKGNLGSEDERITLKLPKYAKKVTITSDYFNRIFGKNAISQTTDVRFENVEFSSSANYDAKNYSLEIVNSVFFVNNLTAKKLMTMHSGVEVTGKANIAEVIMQPCMNEDEINGSSITAFKALNITDITGKGILEIHNAFTAKPWKKAATQFTLKGDVSKDVILDLRPLFYDSENKNYYEFLNEDGYFDWEVFGEQSQDLMVTGNETPAAFKKFMTAKNISSMDNILYYGMDHENVWPMEYKGGIYFTNIPNALSVSVIKTEGQEPEVLGEFRSWTEAINTVDALNHADWEYIINVNGNVGADRDTPLKNFTLPSKAKRVIINGNSENISAIITTGTKITLKTDTVFNNLLIAAVNKKGESVPYTVNVGKHELILENMVNEIGGEEAGFYYNCDMKISGTKDSVVDVRFVADHGQWTDMISQISKVGMVFLNSVISVNGMEGSGYDHADYYIENGISGVGKIVLDKGVSVSCGEKDFSVQILTMSTDFMENTREDMWTHLQAKNITVSDRIVMHSLGLKAGTNTAGDGKITLNNAIFMNSSNHIEGKVDAKGNSLVNIKGNVTIENEEIPAGDSLVTISLCKSNSAEEYVQLTEGMTLLTAPKASASIFRPDYDGKMEKDGGEDDGDPTNDIPNEEERRMGWEEWLIVEHTDEAGNMVRDFAPKTGLYNSGNYIKYGTVREVSEDNYIQDTAEARLWIGTTTLDENSWNQYLHMDFKTFEEAVEAIDKMAIQKAGTDSKQKVYETYALELMHDVEIGNEKGDGKYKTIKLPSKASELYIYGCGRNIKYTGNVTLRCNTSFDNIILTPLKYSKKNVVPMKSNFALGNYTLNNWGLDCGYFENPGDYSTFVDCIGKVTGSAKSGKLVMNLWAYMSAESISGLKTIEFKGNGEEFGYASYIDENGNTVLARDEEGNLIKYRARLIVSKDLKVKEIVYTDYVAGLLYVEGKLTTDSIKVDGEVEAEIFRNPQKAMKVNGVTLVGENNSKTSDSVIFVPYIKDGEEVNSELKLHLVSKDGTEVKDGMKLMSGKYLNADDWSVDIRSWEDNSLLGTVDVTANEKNTILYVKK